MKNTDMRTKSPAAVNTLGLEVKKLSPCCFSGSEVSSTGSSITPGQKVPSPSDEN